MPELGDFLTRLFAQLESRAVPYCVLRSSEGLPHTMDGDLDILVEPGARADVESALGAAREDALILRRFEKDRRVHFHVLLAGEVQQAIEQDRPAHVIELDFQTEVQWQGVRYLDRQAVLASRRREGIFYVADRPHQVSNIVAHAVLEKGFLKSKHKGIIGESMDRDGPDALAPLAPFLGRSTVGLLYAALRSGQDDAILGLRRRMIRSLLFSRAGSIPAWFAFLLRRSLNAVGAVLVPRGTLVATAGPDGSGKSTLIRRVRNVLSGSFDPIREQIMGAREWVLPTKRWLEAARKMRKGDTPPSGSVWESTKVAKFSWTDNLGVLHYFLDLWLRYILYVRPVLMRGGLVLCDRYFYDLFARDVWLCRNPAARAVLLKMIPRPLTTVFFIGDPQVISARKREISPRETERQLLVLASVRDTLDAFVEIEAMGPLHQNVRTVLGAIDGQLAVGRVA